VFYLLYLVILSLVTCRSSFISSLVTLFNKVTSEEMNEERFIMPPQKAIKGRQRSQLGYICCAVNTAMVS